jgi:membrane-bound acyltransferase YfiQ involved in biofilm formation
VGLQCIGSWHVLVVIAALLSADQFPNGLANWYLASVVLVLIGMLVLYIVMERQRMRVRTQPA